MCESFHPISLGTGVTGGGRGGKGWLWKSFGWAFGEIHDPDIVKKEGRGESPRSRWRGTRKKRGRGKRKGCGLGTLRQID